MHPPIYPGVAKENLYKMFFLHISTAPTITTN
jgi:hypothetical protein